jgi:protease IV
LDFVLALTVHALRFALKALFWPFARIARALAVRDGAWIALHIDGPIADFAPPRPFWRRMSRRRGALTLLDMSELAQALTRDSRVRGLVVTITSMQAGMATATGLRALLARVRRAGKELVVHLPCGADTKEMYVASVAHRIFVGPQSTLAPLGFSTSVRYVKGALAKAGLVPQIVARGEYKSAGEQLVRESMSDAQREQLEAIYEVFYAELLLAIGEGRKVNRDRAKELVDDAPYRAERAIEVGLVDGTAYEDEIALKVGDGGEPAVLVPALRYLRLERRARLPRFLPGPIVGVIPIHGTIAGTTPLGVAGAMDDKVIAQVRAARADRRVKSVLLHVESPGGSSLASDRIHHEIEQLAKEKPVVACFANVAASGGYYVAAPAHEIFAQSTTITGSIGVVAARVVIEPLLQKVGIVTETVKRGARAGMFDVARPLTDDEQGVLEREIDGVYRAFVEVVARGREQTMEQIERVAQGRVWTGAEASSRRLVDRLGGFDEALASARRRAGDDSGELAPVVLRAPRAEIAPLDPPARAARVLLRAIGVDPGLLALARARERVLVWSELASWIDP